MSHCDRSFYFGIFFIITVYLMFFEPLFHTVPAGVNMSFKGIGGRLCDSFAYQRLDLCLGNPLVGASKNLFAKD